MSGAEPSGAGAGLIWGINPVLEALHAGRVGEVRVVRGKGGPRLQEIIDQARRKRIRIRFVEPRRLGVPSSARHQGVAARLEEAHLLDLDRFLSSLDRKPDSERLLLLLDSIQDPRNLGSILRSALAAGFDHVLLTSQRSAPVTGTVARASAGAVAHLVLGRAGNLRTAQERLKERGFWIYGAVADEPGARSIHQVEFSGAVALVVGSEGKGIRPLVRRSCDELVTIPMRSGFDSLNVSVAAAVIMFEIVRQRANRG